MSRSIGASMRPSLAGVAGVAGDASTGAWLVAGVVLLCVAFLALLCAAARTEGLRSCARLCSVTFAMRPVGCPDARNGYVDVSEINDAVIGAAYHPERYSSLRHPKGFVYLASLTMRDTRDLGDTSALRSLIAQVTPEHAEALTRSLEAANARPAPVQQAERNFAEQIMLDSAQAEGFLTATTLADVPLVVTSTLPKRSPNDPVPGVLTLSRPGVDSSSSMAIVVAVTRSPQSLARDHVEHARLLLVERHGLAWRVTHQWTLPVSTPLEAARRIPKLPIAARQSLRRLAIPRR